MLCSLFVRSRMLANCPHTWSVHRGLHASLLLHKKRKTDEEKHSPNMIKYAIKSKHKTGDVVEVWRNITVVDLAAQMNRSVDHVFQVMDYVKDSDKYRKPYSVIENFKVVEEIVKKSGLRYKMKAKEEKVEVKDRDVYRRDPSTFKNLKSRPPVVTIMGHVDHGKTTLLDHLRHSHIVESEFGGITQHIGAFSVLINDRDRITFLDTPGHAAFCAMRNRGAQCTDIVVLVIAADDGVMEQTVESIRMAKEAQVPIIVAINKIDKPQADVERTKKMLLQQGIQVEDGGGDVQVVPISALKGTNVDVLVESILAQAELMELTSDYGGAAEAVVIESSTDPHRGKLCTILVQCGTIKRGSILVAGEAWCKIRAMFNDKGEPVKEATPSTPVQTLGWRELPSAGDVAIEVDSEKRAHEVVHWRKSMKLVKKQEEDQAFIAAKVEEHYKEYKAQLEAKRKMGRFRLKPTGPRKKEIQDDDDGPVHRVIVKGDVDGSVEAILDVLETYDSEQCKLDVVHYGVGPVSHSDVELAKVFSAIIYTFNIGVLDDAKKDAKEKKVPIKYHNVIYKLVDDIKKNINELLPMKEEEEILGEANVLQEFLINEGRRKIPVAGCRCTKGVLKKSAHFRLLRNDEVIFDGSASSLRHIKDEVESIKKDVECGLMLSDKAVNFKQGDVVQCYVIKKVPQEVVWDPGF